MSRGSTKLLSLPPAVLAPASKPSEPLPVIARVLSRGDNESINYNAAPEPIGPQFETEDRPISGRLTAIIITCVTCVTAISSLLNGLVAIAIPTMARDLGLASGLILWPSSIYFLTAGCTLLLFGSLADVVGSRTMYLIGCGLQSIITLACGLVRTSTQLIIFRALAGLAISCCLPSAVSIITNTFPLGGRRNIAFGAMGGGQSVGFVLGMVFGGVFTGTIGWRWGFHAAAVINTLVFFTALFGLPKRAAHVADAGDAASGGVMSWRRQLRSNIDWVGNLIASTSLAMLAYVLAVVSSGLSHFKSPINIILLCVSIALLPAFVLWVGRQERLGRPAVIPNSLWRNRSFTSICIIVFVVWGAYNSAEITMTLVFQKVQLRGPTQAALLTLPSPISGILVSALMGLFVARVPANWLVVGSTAISCAGPLLMALMPVHFPSSPTSTPASSYWAFAAPGFVLNSVGADVLFTVSNLIITASFPSSTQALAGGVFNALAQIGQSAGLTIAALVSAAETAKSPYTDKDSPEALVGGYRAIFWWSFSVTLLTGGLSIWGLRHIGKVGVKRD